MSDVALSGHASFPRPTSEVVALAPTASTDLPVDLTKSASARRLFELEQLDVSWDAPTQALWTFMRPRGRPSYNLDFLVDFHDWQRGIVATFPIVRISCAI